MKLSLICLVVLTLFGIIDVNGSPLNTESTVLNLQNDLDDFLKLIPQEKIEDLLYEYLAEDEDVAELLEYLLSDEFKDLLVEVESLSDFRKFLNYLEKAGIKAYDIVNQINDFLGAEKIKPLFKEELEDPNNGFFNAKKIEPFFEKKLEDQISAFADADRIKLLVTEELKNLFNDFLDDEKIKQIFKEESDDKKISGGLPGFIKDLEKIIPVDKIEKLYYEKLKKSKDFAALVKHLQSKEFQQLVDKVILNPKVEKIIQLIESKGVDVDEILNLITSIIGIKFPPRPVALKEEEVIDILKEIWSYVPMDDLFDLIIDYMVDDEEFQIVVEYMLGDEFKKILLDIEKLPELKALVKYFNSIGMDVYDWLNSFHDLIGLPPVKPLMNRNKDITGGVSGLIKDIRKLLPINELYKYYDEKLETSQKFRDFVKRLQTGELQKAVDALGKHKGFQSWLTALENFGVDLNELAEIISAITGIKFPSRPSSF